MGKVSRRLTIVVFPPLGEWPEIVKLEEQGHEIVYVPFKGSNDIIGFQDLIATADLVIGPRCWYLDARHRKYLTNAIKQSRLRRYGTPQRKAGKKDAEDTSVDIDVDVVGPKDGDIG